MWWDGVELNHRDMDFQSIALPAELPPRIGGFPGIFIEAHNHQEPLNLYLPLLAQTEVILTFNLISLLMLSL